MHGVRRLCATWSPWYTVLVQGEAPNKRFALFALALLTPTLNGPCHGLITRPKEAE